MSHNQPTIWWKTTKYGSNSISSEDDVEEISSFRQQQQQQEKRGRRQSHSLSMIRGLSLTSVAMILFIIFTMSFFRHDDSRVMPSTMTTTMTTTKEIPSTSISTSSTPANPPLVDHNKESSHSSATTIITTGATTTVDFTFRRLGYDALDYFNPNYNTSYLTYTFLSENNYQAVIEPSASMEFYLYDNSMIYSNDWMFEYIICPVDVESESSDSCQSGYYYYDNTTETLMTSTIKFTGCTPHNDTYSITVFTVSKTTGEVLSTYTTSAICLYVRREIRSLTNTDLNLFLDTLYSLYNMSVTTENELEALQSYYNNENFYTIYQFVQLHYYNSGQRDADHLHEGNGFYLQHVKLTNMLETSLQCLEDSVSIPYWDYTMDHALGYKAFDNFIATEHVFGSITYPEGESKGFTRPDNKVTDAMIPDGRWSELLAFTYNTSDSTNDLTSAYGYLRAPWCLNPSPYVSRYAFDWDQINIGYLPSCKSHYNILQYTDMMDYFYEISLDPHGTTHTVLGGIYGCDAMDYLTEAGVFTSNTSQYKACGEMANIIKESYRSGYLTIPTNCSVNSTDPGSTYTNCSYTCTSESKGYAAAAFMYGRIHSTLNTTAYSTKELFSIFKEFLCEGAVSFIYAGDHYESSAMSDPSFWVIHPTIERLTHAKFLSGGFGSESWANSTENDFVCEKQTCYNESTDSYTNETSCCYGHYQYDRMYNGISFTRDEYVGITNDAMLTASDPRSTSYSVNYIYDKFEWSHCESSYSISDLLETLYTASSSSTDDENDDDDDQTTTTSTNRHGTRKEKGKRVSHVSAKELETREKLQKIVDHAKQLLLNQHLFN